MPEEFTSDVINKAHKALEQNQLHSDALAYKTLFESAQESETFFNGAPENRDLNRRLQVSGMLPDLCIGYLKVNFHDLDKNYDGKLTKNELESVTYDSKSRIEQHWDKQPDSEINQMLLMELTLTDSLFTQIASSATESGSRDGIEVEDLVAQSKERMQSVTRNESNTLLSWDAGSWMAYLDEKDGNYDGFASAGDIAEKTRQAYPRRTGPADFGSGGASAALSDSPELRIGAPFLFKRTFRALTRGDFKESLESLNFLKDLGAGKHQSLLRERSLDIVDIMRKSGLKPVVINSKKDYESVQEELEHAPDRPFSRWLKEKVQ